MNSRNESAASLLEPSFAAKLRAANEALLAKFGWTFCIVEGWRSGSQQNVDYQKGREGSQIVNRRQVITNAKAGQSMHQYGLAADIVPYLQGEDGALNWNAESPQFHAMVEALKGQGLSWGGDWKSIGDFDHFQVADLPYTPTEAMQADYRAGVPNPTIWERYHQNLYADAIKDVVVA